MTPLAIYAALGVLVLLVCWLGGWSFATDAGGAFDSTGMFYPWSDRLFVRLSGRRVLAADKRKHATLGAVLGFASVLYTRDLGGAVLVTFALGCGWECVEAFPLRGFRDPSGVLRKRVGCWSWKDVVADMGGALPASLVAALILSLAGAIAHRHARAEIVPPAVVARVDSARATETPDSLHRDTLYREAAANVDSAHHRVEQVAAARHYADFVRDSLQGTETPSTPEGWRTVAQLQTARGDSLDRVVAQQDTAIVFLTAAQQAEHAAAMAAESRLAALEHLNRDLVAVTEALKKPPRRLHWRPCLYGGGGPSLSLAGIGVQPQVGGGACLTYDRG